MREQWFSFFALVILGVMVGGTQATSLLPPEAAPLIRHFYKVHNTCANVEPFVRHQVGLVWANDKSVAPKLIKLLYADCMVNVCHFDPSHSNTILPSILYVCMYMYIFWGVSNLS